MPRKTKTNEVKRLSQSRPNTPPTGNYRDHVEPARRRPVR